MLKSSEKQYVSNIRLCIVHLLNAIELTTDLGMILLRTFKVKFSLARDVKEEKDSFQRIQSNDVAKFFSPFCLAFIFALPKDRTIKGKVMPVDSPWNSPADLSF